jgi:hypothetical protein
MSRLWMPALLCACVLTLTAAPAAADGAKQPPADPRAKKPEPKELPKTPAKTVDLPERIIDALAHEFPEKQDFNLNDVPLFELLQDLSKKFAVPFVINEESFKAVGRPNLREEKPTVSLTTLRDLSVHQFLTTTLDSLGATYLVKGNGIEIVPVQHAAKLAKIPVDQGEDGRARLTQPLVSAIFKEKPLNEAVAAVAEKYDLTVVVSPQAGDARTGFVSARMLNMPADKALELLALQADLRVVRRGAAFLITSKEHATELFNEKLDRERQKIELEKFRVAPPPKPASEPKQ